MRIKRETKNWKDERGVSLFIALLTLLIISLLTTGIIFVTQTETFTTANYTELAQARYAAEAGVQSTMNWLSNSYTAPSSFASYNTSAVPVTCASGCANNGAPVVLSGMSGVSSNYPDSTVSSAYNTALSNQTLAGLANASFSTSATMVSITGGSGATWLGGGGGGQTWQITSQGTVAGIRTATVQVTATYERGSGSAIFTYAAFGNSPGCASVMFSGGGGTDSFDSSAGTYAATEQLNGAGIGSNGSFDLSGGGGTAPIIKTISGTLSTPKTGIGTCVAGSPNALHNGSGWTTGGLNQLSGSVTLSNPIPASPTPPTTAQDIRNNCSGISGCSCYPGGGYACTNNGPYKLTPGIYGNLNLSGGKTLHLTAGTYNVDTIVLSGGATVIIDSGPVILQATATGVSAGSCCAVNFSGGTVSNIGGNPANFQIVSGSSADIDLSGGSGDYAVVYAPNSAITISGGGDLYGAVIGSTVNNSGGTSIHYDRALQNQLLAGVGGFRLIGFSWSKF